MRCFNTSGCVVPAGRCCIPPQVRIDRAEALTRLRRERRRCVCLNSEAGPASREKVEGAMRTILYEMAFKAHDTLGDESPASLWPLVLEMAPCPERTSRPLSPTT